MNTEENPLEKPEFKLGLPSYGEEIAYEKFVEFVRNAIHEGMSFLESQGVFPDH